MHTFLASRSGAEIVLDGGDLRWTFSDIEADTFAWRNEAREGHAWRLQQTLPGLAQLSPRPSDDTMPAWTRRRLFG